MLPEGVEGTHTATRAGWEAGCCRLGNQTVLPGHPCPLPAPIITTSSVSFSSGHPRRRHTCACRGRPGRQTRDTFPCASRGSTRKWSTYKCLFFDFERHTLP